MKKRFHSRISPFDYDQAAVILREVGDQMLGRLDVVTLQPKCIVEVGCATGYCASLLSNRYPGAQVIAMDESATMIDYAKAQCDAPIDWVCAPLEPLPLADHSVDLLVSNVTVAWCNDIETTMTEWRRVLRPGGLLMMSGLGVDTLRECPPAALLAFSRMDMHDVGDILMRSGFADPVMDVDYFELHYKNQEKLASELSVMGLMRDEHIVLSPDEKGRYSLSIEVFYAHAWGGPEKQFTTEDGLTSIPLAHLRRQLRGE